MPSEELEQRYPACVGTKFGRFEVFECQLTTIRQFGEHGIIPDRDYGNAASQKPDTLVITRVPDLLVCAVGERKAPGDLNDSNWGALAKDLLETKCRPLGAPVGFLTDGNRTYWINGKAEEVEEIRREDGQPLPGKIDFGDATFRAEFEYILSYFEAATNLVRAKTRTDPQQLAQEVWQTVWRLKADRPEDCLATFVELFVFKFLEGYCQMLWTVN